MGLEQVLDKRVVRTFAQTISRDCRQPGSRSLFGPDGTGGVALGGKQGQGGSQTAENAARQPEMEKQLDRRVAAGASRTRSAAVGSAGSYPHWSLGWLCTGEE